MGKTKAICLLLLGLVSVMTGSASAADDWSLEINASVLNAQNKLVIGQNTIASDSIDGLYDIPALLSGDIKAYMPLDGQFLWTDLRASCDTSCEKQWNIVIESPLTGELIRLSWDPDQIPDGMSLVLVDTDTGVEVDMSRESAFSFENTYRKELLIIRRVP